MSISKCDYEYEPAVPDFDPADFRAHLDAYRARLVAFLDDLRGRSKPMPDLDLEKHRDRLGDPAAYFVDHEGRHRALVVEHATGLPRFVLEPDGTLGEFDPANPLGPHGIVVHNPPGFAGHPEHDRDDPRYDLGRYAKELGDPAAHFVHFDNPVPLVVRHADGQPTHRITESGLEPYRK